MYLETLNSIAQTQPSLSQTLPSLSHSPPLCRLKPYHLFLKPYHHFLTLQLSVASNPTIHFPSLKPYYLFLTLHLSVLKLYNKCMPKTKKQPYENTDSIGMNVMRIK